MIMSTQTITLEDLRWLPPTVNLTEAARMLGIGRTTAYALAHADAFPCKVLRVGAQYRVITADLLHLLSLDTNGQARLETPPEAGER